MKASLTAAKVMGPMVHAARIAALCAVHGVRELYSADRDFSRFGASDRAETIDLVKRVTDEFGGLDVVASEAGVEHFGALESITPADFDRVFHTNVAGRLFVTQAAAAVMTGGGRVLLTSSVSARIAVYQHTLDAASKAAESAMVLNLAPELAERRIAINAIAPGGTNRDGRGVRRQGASCSPSTPRQTTPNWFAPS